MILSRFLQLTAALGISAVTLLAVSCGGEPSESVPSATAPASPSVASTEAPNGIATQTPMPTEEPADPTRPPGVLTGIAEVDQVIDSIVTFDGDYSELEALVRYTITKCTLQLGMGGPPKCWNIPEAEQTEGAEVVVFPFSVCEAEWEPRSEDLKRVLAMLAEPGRNVPGATAVPVIEVYGIYTELPVTEPSDWPSGDYAVVFATRFGGELRGTTVRVADGGIVSIEFGCGSTLPAVMAAGFAGQLLEPPLSGLLLSGDGVIETVEELPPHATQETSPLWHVVVDLVAPVGGYRAVLVDEQTILLNPDGTATAIGDLVPGASVAVSGVPLPWSLWRADQIIIGD